jgi:hypothetical protein
MQQYQLERVNPKTGYLDRIVYTGSLKQKPRGWSVIEAIQPNTQFAGLV